MIQSFKIQQNPLETHDLRTAIHWLIDSWTVQIEKKTIYNCFRKSTIIDEPAEHIPDISGQLQLLYDTAKNAGNIKDAMNLKSFLNPIEESLEIRQLPSLDNIRTDLIDKHFGVQENPDEPEDDVVGAPDATDDDAQEAIKTLMRWAEQQPSTQNAQVVWIKRFERFIANQKALRIQEQRRQASITSFFQQQ